jgi:hypothetical protein
MRTLAIFSGFRATARAVLTSFVLAAAAGCSDGGSSGGSSSGGTGGGGTTPPTPTPGTLAIALASGSLSVAQGQSGTVAVTLTRGGSFTGAVDLTIEGAPTGVTASATPAQVAAGATTATITVQAAATAAAGTATLTVRAKGSGVTDATAAIALTVTAVTPPGGIALALSGATVSVVQGQTATLGATLTRSGSFAGAVALTVEGLPTGVTANVTPASVAAGATTATITLTAAATAAAGSATITIRGTGTGVTAATATASLTVTAAPPAGSFTLALSPTSASLQQGQSTTVTVSIGRAGGFTGTVNLTATVPTGITAAFSSQAVTGTTATLTLTAAATASVGAATVTVAGSATGIASASAQVALTITAPPPATGSIAWTYCGTDRPVYFAVQDGTGPWSRVSAGSDGVFRFDISSSRGGVAAVQAVGNGHTMKVYYFTRDELVSQGRSFCDDPGTRTVTGTVAGVAATDLVNIGFAGKAATVSPSAGTAWTLTNVSGGTRDLVAARAALSLSGLNVSYTLSGLLLRRNVAVGSGGAQPVLDFASSAAITPASANLTLANLNGEFATLVTMFATANSGSGALLYTDVGNTATTRTWRGVPAASQASGDLHTLIGSATASLTNSLVGRQATLYTSAVADRTLTFGPALGAVTTGTVAGSGMVRFRSQYTMQAQYNRLIIVQYQQTSNARIHEIQASSGYLGGTSVDVSVPDLSGLSGWLAAYGLASGVSTTWTFTASGWTGGSLLGLQADGTLVQSASTGATVTP